MANSLKESIVELRLAIGAINDPEAEMEDRMSEVVNALEVIHEALEDLAYTFAALSGH